MRDKLSGWDPVGVPAPGAMLVPGRRFSRRPKDLSCILSRAGECRFASQRTETGSVSGHKHCSSLRKIVQLLSSCRPAADHTFT